MSVRDIIQAAAGVGGAPPVNPAWDLSYAYWLGPRNLALNTYDVQFNSDETVFFAMPLLDFGASQVLQYDYGTPGRPDTGVVQTQGGYSVAAQELTPTGVEFKPDGTKMYVIGSTGDDINEYTLSSAWDETTASFVQTFSVSAQTGAIPAKVRFKDDGTSMYVLSNTNDAVYQYNLSSAWDISTSSYSGVSFSVADQEATPLGMFFGDSGSKMYIVGPTNDIVYQYALSTPWDLSTASYPGINRGPSIAGYETTPTDVKFNNDGTRMYVLGTGTDAVLQYNLGTAYQPSTAVFPRKSVAAEEASNYGVDFKPDGTKMYVVGQDGNDIGQYDLSTAWDVTTASYVQNFSVSAQTGTAPATVIFKDDGTRMFVLSNTNDTVFQYTLTSAWDISTASYDSVSFSVASQEGNAFGMFIGDSGAKMYICGIGADTVFQYTLSTPWDLSTASYASLSFSVNAQESNPYNIFFKTDGTVMYVTGASARSVVQYALSSAWDVSTASFTQTASPSFSAFGMDTQPGGIYIKPDGTQLYMSGPFSDSVWQLSMSTAWDVSTLRPGFYVGSQEGTPNGLAFKDDGTKMYVVGSGNDTVYQYSLSTAWDTLTASYDSVSFSVASQEANPRGITFKTDGTKMYIIGSTGADVNEYDLGTAWNVSTASYVQNFSVSAQAGATPVKVEFKSDGTKMYVASATTDEIYEYALSSAWNISTASYSSVSYAIETITGETSLTGLAFADSGAKMYIVGQGLDRVQGFILTSAWDLSTANAYSFLIGAQNTAPTDVFLSSDGLTMITTSNTANSFGTPFQLVYGYSLGTAWKVDTSSYSKVSPGLGLMFGETLPQGMYIKPDGTQFYFVGQTTDTVWSSPLASAWNARAITSGFSFLGQDSQATGITMKPDGTKLYMLGTGSDKIYQYSLSTAWDIHTISYDAITYDVSGQTTDPVTLAFKPDGTKMYIFATNGIIYEYSLSVAWDLSTISYVQNVTGLITPSGGMLFSQDGTKLLINSFANLGPYRQYVLNTPWDISTISLVESANFNIAGGIYTSKIVGIQNGLKVYTNAGGRVADRQSWNLESDIDFRTINNFSFSTGKVRSITFDPTGVNFYTVLSNGIINQYSLTTPWEISLKNNLTLITTFNPSAQSAAMKVQFKEDGTKMFMLSQTNDAVYEYNLSTAWDISTLSYTSVSFSVSTQENDPYGMYIGDSGSVMYIVGLQNDTVYQYALSTPWDLSTASYTGLSKSVNAQEAVPRSVFVGDSGNKMYVAGTAGDDINEYSLSTPWDVSTATFTGITYAFGSEQIAIWFSPDGLIIYNNANVNSVTDRIYQSSITTSATPYVSPYS